ncbi:hypothetical protein A9Q79_07910 [Methylophaga sp. 42_25_T18]|nr:hypothetical protein A9Q79_07910 [Methylophaga sp. 42_25_T18]
MIEPFQPDIFSEIKPVFSDVGIEKAEEIKKVFKVNYDSLNAEITRVRKFGGIELNSNNFRIDTDKGQFILKVFDDLSERELEAIEKQHALMAWLYMNQVSCPFPHKGQSQTYICRCDDGKYISLLSFIDGGYFPGIDIPEIRKVGEAVGKFHAQLNLAPNELKPNRKYPHLSSTDKEVFNDVISQSQKILSKFPTEHRSLLVNNNTILNKAWAQVLSYQDDFIQSKHGLVHIDIHPHNVIMSGNSEPIFLDFDSLMHAPLKMMLGFSAYKLLRQIVSRNGNNMSQKEKRALVYDYLEGALLFLPDLDLSPKSVAIFAYTEICRRISCILRLNIFESNPSWNHVLEVQIAGLAEVELLCGELS